MTTTHCSVLAIEDTFIQGNNVTVTAVVEDMRLLYRASYRDPEEWAPALCTASFELDDDEQIPTDEDGFCCYLHHRDLEWQLVDVSDYDD
jgi:hypothetical protein